MKYLFLVLNSFFSFISLAQTEQVLINGKQYYVYPFQREVDQEHQRYLLIMDSIEQIKRDDKNRKIVKSVTREISEFEKDELYKENSYIVDYSQYDEIADDTSLKISKKEKKKIKKIIEERYHEVASLTYLAELHGIQFDPTPVLTAIPDGEYVLFFKDVPFISGKTVRFKNDIPSAFFTVKNNLIEGVINYFDLSQNSMFKGQYEDGLRSGEWKTVYYDLFTVNGEQSRLDSIRYVNVENYKYGLLDGISLDSIGLNEVKRGHYTEGKKDGEWFIYDLKESYQTVYFEKKAKSVKPIYEEEYFNDDVYKEYINPKWKNVDSVQRKIVSYEYILIEHFTYNDDTTFYKNPFFMFESFHSSFDTDSLVLSSDFLPRNWDNSLISIKESYEFFENDSRTDENYYGFILDFTSLIQTEKESDEDLSEENFNAYEEGFEENEYYGDYGYFEDSDSTFNADEHYLFNKKQYSYNDYLDSTGYKLTFDGLYESYFTNGQLRFQLEGKNGKINFLSPVYYSNGKITSELITNPDSTVTQHFYDFNGKLYKSIIRNKLGNVISKPQKKAEVNESQVSFGGEMFDQNFGYPCISYNNSDILEDSISDKILYKKEIYKLTGKVASEMYWYPKTRTLIGENFNLKGEPFEIIEMIVSEDTLSANLKQTITYKNIERVNYVSFNGSSIPRYEGFKQFEDKLMYLLSYGSSGEFANFNSKTELKVDGQLFNGRLKLSKGKKGKIDIRKSKIAITIPSGEWEKKQIEKTHKEFRKNSTLSGKYTELYAQNLSSAFLNKANIVSDYVNFFRINIEASYDTISEVNSDSYNVDYSDEYLSKEEKKQQSKELKKEAQFRKEIPQSLISSFVNGAQEGTMIVYNKDKKVAVQVPFQNGLINGNLLVYEYAHPKLKQAYEYAEVLDVEEIPLKSTYYLNRVIPFKNNLVNGLLIGFNWQGDTVNYENQYLGAKDGLCYERSKYFYRVGNYTAGDKTGIHRLFFIKENLDSTLLHEISYQNGQLQGEARSFHLNGTIAKRGFFFDSKPIDDYEAYDSLGFKYQYVKFEFGQPVEEKIWEQNLLSSKYEFDWRDSIYFDINDLVNVADARQMMYQYMEMKTNETMSYFGRPSLLYKENTAYKLTKYYPNDKIARTGYIEDGKKVSCWKHFSYSGDFLYEVDYFDTLIVIDPATKFKVKGILTYVDKKGNDLSKSWIIEKVEKYDCAHADHNEERLLYCFWEKDTTQKRINGYVKNYYDNGTVQNEGVVKNGLPVGNWKMYDPNGNLNQVGEFKNGKRIGRWLKGDLGNVKNMSEICLNPNLENLEEILKYQENLLDVTVVVYKYGKEISRQYFGINQNSEASPEGFSDQGY